MKNYDQHVTHYFENIALTLPHQRALIIESTEFSYQKLNEEANRLAHYLISQNLEPKPIIAILMNRSVDMVVSLLAVLKIGGSYLPIDPDLPSSRILYMLENSNANVILSQSSLANSLSLKNIPAKVIFYDQLTEQLSKQQQTNLDIGILPEDRMYIIYTSGSTGNPKGCILNNQAVYNRLLWMQETFNLDANDLVLQKTSYGFDVSVWEFFWPLITGATLVLAKPGGHKDPTYLVKLIKTEGITVCHFVPSMLNIFLQEQHVQECTSLRYVMCSGEALKPNTVQAFYEKSNAQLINLYGPTEAAIDVTYWMCSRSKLMNSVPIGKPIKNVDIHILDQDLNELPSGTIGEICISGICLADGYINQEELTNKSFKIKKFDNGKILRIYKTGDLGRFLQDGNIEYLGRINDQIKLRGNRIELGEIETLLRSHSSVKDVVVLAINNNQDDGYIVAFVILNGEKNSNEKELKDFLKNNLPEYMVPAKIIQASSFPLSENGKISKNALIDKHIKNKEPDNLTDNSSSISRNDLLISLRESLKTLLNLNDINNEADLFEVGATSFTMMKLTQLLNKKFNLQISPEVLLDNPSINGIIQNITKLPPSKESKQVVESKRDKVSSNNLQTELTTIVLSLLKIESINIDDDLFAMGATSFTIMRILQELNKRYDIQIPPDVILANPSITGIYDFLASSTANNELKNSQCAENYDIFNKEKDSNKNENDIIVNLLSKEELTKFKEKQINLRKDTASSGINLIHALNDKHNHFIQNRATKREFNRDTITLENFSKFLSALKCETLLNEEKFHYPSAGSTYAVQLYIHLKKNAVENLDEGIYYYHPKEHKLYLISSAPDISNNIHFYYNKPIYDNASFSLYFIAQMGAIQPIYGEHSKQFVTIEVGSMLQLLMTQQAESEIGLCPVGTVNFDSIKHYFQLDRQHEFIQCILGGSYLYQKVQRDHTIAQQVTRNDKFIQRNTDIAIIGMSGRYPGAKNLDEYWEVLKSGVSQIKEVPSERWNYKDYYKPEIGAFGKWGGFLNDIDKFDPLLFKIAPKEAHSLDPQQRLLLQQVWETLEDAGYTAEILNQYHDNVGVYVGVMWDDYKDVASSYSKKKIEFSSARHAIANRISHVFNFQGPSLVIDTSCSSALTALHLACESIKNGESSTAIVGGVNLILHPNHLQFLSDINMISHDHRSCAFSENGTGWVPGEGVGCILIKPLSKAIEDGDNIHGVIKTSAINHSGRSHQYGMPNPKAQSQLMQDTLRKEGIDPLSIDYIECASSGSLLFDSAECSALLQTYTVSENSEHTFRIGSVKPNIGHLESAAALSQLSKVLLQMRHKEFVPTIDTEPQSPLINLEDSPLRIQKILEKWKEPERNLPRRAAISALGGAGSYGHIVIESYEHQYHSFGSYPALIILSAATEEQLRISVSNLLNFINSSQHTQFSIHDIAYTLQIGRVEMAHRVAFIVATLDGLKNKLVSYIHGDTESHLYSGIIKNNKIDKTIDNLNDIEYIAENWVKGARIDWNKLYLNNHPVRVSLPTYPFSNERFWFGEQTIQENPLNNKISPTELLDKNSLLRSHITDYLFNIFSDIFEIPLSRINEDATFEDYGISSLLIRQLHEKLSLDFPNLSKTVFFQCKSISELSDFLFKENMDDLSRMFETAYLQDTNNEQEIKNYINKSSSSLTPLTESKDIAIIGLSGRYPMSETLDEFWSNLQKGKDCIQEIPTERWDYQKFTRDTELTHGNQYCKWGGFLKGVDQFDPLFFNISPREAEKMDPQERLFLETAWEVLEDAGYSPSRLKQNSATNRLNKIGVFVGVMWSEYPYFAANQDHNSPFPHTAYWSIANRVSYCLDLHGPSVSVDTACSASLTAIHLACESIYTGSSTMAIAGGVNLSLHPNKYLGLCQLGFTSSEGKCRSFGAGGDGYVPSEGVGAILLKPLNDALRDRDHIYGVIKSSAINHGGKTNGYTVPDPKAHANLIIDALNASSINPREIAYVEAHGTGTPLGDPIEIQGLSDAFNNYTNDKSYCAIGSVKSNIGHAEAAAGIAGLTKILLQYKFGKLVPTIHSEESNPDIRFDQTPFYLQKRLEDWEGHKYSSISSFGAGGANVHMIIANAPEKPFTKAVKPFYLVTLSAKNEIAFKQKIRDMISWLKMHPNDSHNLECISFTFNTGREHFLHRGAWVVASKGELLNQLNDSLEENKQQKFSIGVVNALQKKDDLINKKLMTVLEEELKSSILAAPEKYKETLIILSKLYIDGYTPKWSILHEGGSNQKISLPTYPFTRESYWITDRNEVKCSKIVNVTSILSEQRKTILYQKSWNEVPLVFNERDQKSIIIYDQYSEALANNLLKHQSTSLLINVTDLLRYSAKDLSEYNGWIDLSSSLSLLKRRPLLSQLQLWIESTRSTNVAILQVTAGLESLSNDKVSLLGAEKVGLYRMLNREYAHVTSVHLDLEMEMNDLDEYSNIILREINSLNSEIDICYRNKKRFVATLKEVGQTLSQTKKKFFTESDVLLITGGTKGIGLLLARHFVLNYGVKKLVLTGKEQVPPRELWSNLPNFSDSIVKKIESFLELEKLGAEVKVLSTPLNSAEAIRQEVKSITNSMGPIAGLIHAAGQTDSDNPAFIRKSIEKIESVLAPKVDGLRNLLQAVNQSELNFVILCSSVSAIIPKLAVGLSDYSAANAFMDYFATAHHKEIPLFSIQWPSWKETGMGEVVSKIYQESGMLSITDLEGLNFIDLILSNSLNGTVMPLIVDPLKFDLSKLLPTRDIIPFITEKDNFDKESTIFTSENIQELISRIVEGELKLKSESLNCNVPLAEYGVDSILLAQIVRKINKTFDLELDLSHLLEYQTVGKITEWLIQNESDKCSRYFQNEKTLNFSLNSESANKPTVNSTNIAISKESIVVNKNIIDTAVSAQEPIAIIGMSCQFPGANSLEAYWELLLHGQSAISSVPENCWGIKTEYFAGLIERIYEFDPDFFLIPKEDAMAMDPQAMLLLRESLGAIHDSHYSIDEVKSSDTGVYVGARSQHRVPEKVLKQTRNPIMTMGQNYLAANISHFFNFHGPSLVVDTACSSALVAMNMALEALQLGKIEQALVAGVSLLTNSSTHKLFDQRSLLQKEGIFHVFDERASGVVLGEGVGAVFLKPLRLAQRDGNRIYAVISSISINNDGRTAGPATPSIEAQKKAMQTALKYADCKPEEIQYIDVNGSGSKVTDLLELKSINSVYRNNCSEPLYIGSMKPNIGHPLCAEGIASFIKVCLQLYNQTLVPFLSGEQPLKHFSLSEKNIVLPRKAQSVSLPYAAINCFADGGTNAHVILKRYDRFTEEDSKRVLNGKILPMNLVDTRMLCQRIMEAQQ